MLSTALRTTVVIDYQNVHLVGHALFGGGLSKHETLVHPGLFAAQLVRERNHRQKPGFPDAELARVLVFRGEPSPVHDPRDHGRNQAQSASWQRDAGSSYLRLVRVP